MEIVCRRQTGFCLESLKNSETHFLWVSNGGDVRLSSSQSQSCCWLRTRAWDTCRRRGAVLSREDWDEYFGWGELRSTYDTPRSTYFLIEDAGYFLALYRVSCLICCPLMMDIKQFRYGFIGVSIHVHFPNRTKTVFTYSNGLMYGADLWLNCS